MKYIRTKDGIIPDLMNEVFEKQPLSYQTLGIEPINQADTIEELCDEFVFHIENQGYWVINNYKRALEIAKSYNEDENKFICYGAIWTDKGLIYVAKMNEDGKLCLI